ncbi:MDR family MFS transporter [Streptomyces cavernicola]|uniref:MDR family MFS transporter n=1 Tax=Streptomyces cavernicola TaxID=3043613 RepID=A0ABT6SJI0_9ACTN|nr:MDR family MFS transporter [Streptomyces sp. B-S-A6]MDI3408179.1 MDR family MFS transporter [Streptomyces sp. B-S-A6]
MPSTSEAPPLGRPLIVLAGVQMVGSFAALLDATIVTVALDVTSREFGVSESAVAWVSTAYLLTMALVTPVVGWAIDRFGARRMWMFALTVFLAGSVLCGLAWSLESLVAFRVLQGIGGGLVLPLNMAILAQAAGPDRFGRIMSMVGIPGQLAPILGPVLGGVIVGALGWRWIFFVNIPLCLLALALSWRVLPAAVPPGKAPLDRVGLALLPPGLVLLVYGFSRVADAGEAVGAVPVLCLVASAALLIAFVVHALRAQAPLIDLRLFVHRTFTASAVMTFLHGIAVYGPLLLLPLFYARVRGYEADTVGWLLAPQGIGSLIGISVAGALADRYGPRPLVIGSTVLTLAGTLPFTQLSSDPPVALLSVALVVRGFGVGLLGVANATAAYRDVPQERISRATGTISVVQRIGASSGTAAIALVLGLQLADVSATKAGEAEAYGNTFWWAAGLTLVALIPAALLPRIRPGAAEQQPADDDGAEANGNGTDAADAEPQQRSDSGRTAS